jgi:hypothetical protein
MDGVTTGKEQDSGQILLRCSPAKTAADAASDAAAEWAFSDVNP